MLISTQTLCVPFVCTDSTGAAVAPTGTPTATLYKNGAAQGDAVTVTMSGADGLASVAVTGSQGDCFYLKILATISGVATPGFSLPVYLSKLPAGAGDAMTLTTGERTAVANEVEAQIIDDTDSEKVLQAITNKIAAANPSLAGLTLSAIAAQVRTELAIELSRIDVAVSTRLATSGYTAPPLASSIAALILSNPANKLLTNSSGYVTSTNGGGGGGGGGTQLVVPIVTEGSSRLSSQPIMLFIDEQMSLKLLVKDADGNPRNLTGLDIEFRMSRPPVSVRTLADLRAFELSASVHDDWMEVDSVLNLDGNADGEVEFPIPEFLTKQSGPLACSLRNSTDGETLSRVYAVVQYAA